MTDLQTEFYEKNRKLDELVNEWNKEHKRLKYIKKNVIRPLELEVNNLCIKVHGERMTNYKITSE